MARTARVFDSPVSGSMACSWATTSTPGAFAVNASTMPLVRSRPSWMVLSVRKAILPLPPSVSLAHRAAASPRSRPPSRKPNWMSALWCSSDPPYVTQIRPASRARFAGASVASKTIGKDTVAGTFRETHVVRSAGWVSALLASLVVSSETPCFFAAAVESLTRVAYRGSWVKG
ncbi:hypothetical protein AQJ58_38415 [Streptomyces sp. DSM 15324]|nr:hypothetical protein AQJ58_38415 [Streptomyces sp. DSM 15324]